MIRRLTLENWRAYEHLDLEFEPGATFVVASNGVGKSSIVEGARFALFGFVPPSKEGAPRVAADGATSATVEVELPSGRVMTVSRPYPARARAAATPEVILDGETLPPEELEPLLVSEYGAEASFLARLAMLHSSTVFTEAKGLDLREHLSHVFGVDGLVAALDQAKTLAAAARKAADSARKIAAVSDDELAQLGEVESRADELITEAEGERADAERGLAFARWKKAADDYAAVVGEVESEASALLGRPVAALDLGAVETDTVAALDALRQRRSEIAGRMQAIQSGLAELESAEGSCPVCRRPLEPDDVETARASHEQDLAGFEAELASLDEAEPVRVLDEVRRLRSRVLTVATAGDPPPAPEADAETSEAEALERFDAAVTVLAQRRAILDQARQRRAEGEAARTELEGVTAAYERVAALEAASNALDAARQRILNESVEPLEDLLAENWRTLFVDRPNVGLRGDGTVSRRIGDADLAYEQFSDGEKMVAQLILRVLVLRATTKLGFFWVDEPLEHLDPDSRRALAVLLAQAPEQPSFRQVLVTTYEEPLIRRLRASVPDTHVLYVRPSLN